ncbi:MAG: hypothetical protein QNJ16_15500 [Rhodobacter sp.]|nr:hypothetical protein [Rhodobacter sp.]
MFRPTPTPPAEPVTSTAWTILSNVGAFIQANPWPSLAAFVIAWLFAVPSARASLQRGFQSLGITKITASEIEIAFDTESRKVIERDIQQAFGDIEKFREKGRAAVRMEVRQLGIAAEFDQLMHNIFYTKFRDKYGRMNTYTGKEINARATIHIQDLVFSTQLFQLLDYFAFVRGEGFGRALSTRYGIIGRVWRSEEPASAGGLTDRVATDSSAQLSAKETEAQITEIQKEWGMNRKEAVDRMQRPSYCCIPIRSQHGKTLAVLYIDCNVANFGWQENRAAAELDSLEKACAEKLKASQIPKLLEQLDGNIAKSAPRVDEESMA